MFNYIIWHYTTAIKDIFLICRDFLWFLYNYFSISLLLRTLFSPWKRLGEEKRGSFDPVFLFIDLLMRIFGFIMRSIVIVFGILICVLFIFMTPFFVAIWLVLPPLTFIFLILGIKFLIR